jgi:hypothetical protein
MNLINNAVSGYETSGYFVNENSALHILSSIKDENIREQIAHIAEKDNRSLFNIVDLLPKAKYINELMRKNPEMLYSEAKKKADLEFYRQSAIDYIKGFDHHGSGIFRCKIKDFTPWSVEANFKKFKTEEEISKEIHRLDRAM